MEDLVRNVTWMHAVLTDPAQKISLGHHGWVGGRAAWEGKRLDAGLLGDATAVEKVSVGGACWGLGTAVTSSTPRSTAFRRVVQLILNVLLVDREGEGERKNGQRRIHSCTLYIGLHLLQIVCPDI